MSSIVTSPTDQVYVTGGAIPSTAHALPTPPPPPPPGSVMDPLPVLNTHQHHHHQHQPPVGVAVGGASRDNSAMTLSHVLSGLQEEGDLTGVLHQQPNLTHGESIDRCRNVHYN